MLKPRHAAVLLALLTRAAAGQDATYIPNLAPFVYVEEGQQRGVVHELVQLLAERRQYRGEITPAPLKRRVALLSTRPKAFGTLWREPHNEAGYTWLFRLLDDQVELLALRDSKVDISSVAAARQLRIGVILGSPAEAIAHKLGFAHIETIASVDYNLRKLQLGRIDAWLGLESVAAHAERQLNPDQPTLRRGAVVGTANLYFACGRQCDAGEAARWSAAYNAVRADGTLAALLARYHYR